MVAQSRAFATAWTGYFMDDRLDDDSAKTEMHFKNFVISSSSITGSGKDDVGDFIVDGIKDVNGKVKFDKTYVGAHTVIYEGQLQDTLEGQELVGEWHLSSAPQIRGKFYLLRSKEIEQMREAAFLMVVAKMKMMVGLVRFFMEDIGMALVQACYLFQKQSSNQSTQTRNFTIVSLAAGLFMSIAGPAFECYQQRRHARAGGEFANPGPPPSVDGGSVESDRKGTYSRGGTTDDPSKELLKQEEEEEERKQDAAFKYRLEQAASVTYFEMVSGNTDYIEVLMERPDVPAEVPDLAITDVIVRTPRLRRALILSCLVFWGYVCCVPFVFHITCDGGVPAKASMIFVMLAFMSIFVQLWLAVFTKYGYLMLTHAPQKIGFSVVLSLLGLFDAYSDIAFVALARDCGSWVWKPAGVIVVIGILFSQVLPGIAMLVLQKAMPAALKFLELNLLLILLKPSVG